MIKKILKDPSFWKAVMLTVLFFLFILIYVMEFKHFNLTLNAKRLVVPAVCIGGGIGLLLGLYLQKDKVDPVIRMQTVMACLFGFLVVAPLLASLSNRLFIFGKPSYEEVEFVREQPFYSSRFGAIKGESQMPTGYYLFFYYEARLMRISLKKEFFPGYEEGDLILIPVKKGLWGIDFIQPSLINEGLNAIES